MTACGYLSGQIRVSRFNRRLHALADWLPFIATTLGEVFTTGGAGATVSKRSRTDLLRILLRQTGNFFGWRLPLICRPDGVPVRFQRLPASLHDLTPVHELAYNLPPGSRLLGDKAYNSSPDETTMDNETGVRFVPLRRANMAPHAWFVDDLELRDYRHTIETVNSQIEKMEVERMVCANQRRI